MSECKHETWNSVSSGLKWACGECGKFESDIVDELRQLLATEQAKSAELVRHAQNIVDAYNELDEGTATDVYIAIETIEKFIKDGVGSE